MSNAILIFIILEIVYYVAFIMKTIALQKIKKNSSVLLLILAAAILMLGMLSTAAMWTSENRISSVTWQMLWSRDFWHPYMYWAPYYDKPLMTYWLVALSAKLFGGLNGFTLRLPSAICGIISVLFTYKLGKKLISKRIGLIAAWMLLTTYYIVFFSRVAFSDIYNLAGILVAVYWYFSHKDSPKFFNYLVFFLICAITSLCKGLIAFVIPILAIIPSLLHQGEWRKHLRLGFFIASGIGIIVYLIPFLISHYDFHSANFHAYGLVEVYRENILRFFHPFDHQGSVFSYFIFLPIYALPWGLLLPVAIYFYVRNFRKYQFVERWPMLALALIFIFLTLSGSRRSYYILPAIPFAILAISIWVNAYLSLKLIKGLVFGFYILLVAWFVIAQPIYYLQHNTDKNFAKSVKAKAIGIQPWSQWKIRENDAENPVFYLQPQQSVNRLDLSLAEKLLQNPKQNLNTIWIMPSEKAGQIQSLLDQAKMKSCILLTNKDYVSVVFGIGS